MDNKVLVDLLPNLCVQWEAIQNGHFSSLLLKFTPQVYPPIETVIDGR